MNISGDLEYVHEICFKTEYLCNKSLKEHKRIHWRHLSLYENCHKTLVKLELFSGRDSCCCDCLRLLLFGNYFVGVSLSYFFWLM